MNFHLELCFKAKFYIKKTTANFTGVQQLKVLLNIYLRVMQGKKIQNRKTESRSLFKEP